MIRKKEQIKTIIFPLFILLIFKQLSFSQIDTTLQLEVIEINAVRLEKFGAGFGNQSLDETDLSNYKSSNLAEILSQRTPIFVKSYGLGSLATVSTRGTTATQTAVLWNGFNLQSSMNGTVDFSLIPSILVDKISIQSGSTSASYGSGAIGGAISLENKNTLNEGLRLGFGASAGSFSDYQQYLDVSFGKKWFGSSLKVFNHTAMNDFKLGKDTTQRQINAEFLARGFIQNNTFQLGNNQRIKTFFWAQENERQIPPSRTQGNDLYQQNDNWLRAGAEYSLMGEKHIFKTRIAWLKEDLLFFKPDADSSFSRTNTWISEAEEDVILGAGWRMNLGLNLTIQQAEAIAISDFQERQRLSVFSSIKKSLFKEKIISTINLRQEWTDNTRIPLTATWNNDFMIGKNWKSNIKIAKTYNLPTFNDLFWRDSGGLGNIDLLPEIGWNYEIGMKYSRPKMTFKIISFSNYIQNLIQWLPINGSVWSPVNNKSVWARGIETNFEVDIFEVQTNFVSPPQKDDNSIAPYEIKQKKSVFQLGINAAFTRSTVQEIYEPGQERLIGKQLIHTPLWTGSSYLKINIKNSSLQLQQSLTGKRYTTTDNSEDEILPAFSTANLTISSLFSIKKNKIIVLFKVLNIFNSEYEVILARPMPLRHFQAELQFQF